jgi:hypothetical protein
MDLASAALLVLWVGMALGIVFLAVPIAFHQLPTRELAGKVIGACFRQIDIAAWLVFGLSFLLSYGSRWLEEIKDTGEGIGPLRLWNAALLAALLMCFTSSVIVNPRMEVIRLRNSVALGNLPKEHPDRVVFDRAHSISKQLLGLRLLLAVGLALGTMSLPKDKETSHPAES